MDENVQVMDNELTTPEEPVTETADTQPADNPAEAPTEEPTEPTTPAEESVDGAEANPDPWVLPVKFRHEHRELSQEQATAYAQMGLQYEAEQETRDQLAILAAGRGQSVKEFVGSLMRYDEKILMDEKMEITHGNKEEAEKLFKLDMEARKTAHAHRVQQERDADAQQEQSIRDRIAAEYEELRTHVPELAEFAHVPQSVVNDAVKNGRHLYDAYLRYQHEEGKKIQQNRATQAAAAAASTGSLADSPPAAGMDDVTKAMMRGVWSE